MTCVGSASGPVISPVEMCWSSNSCDAPNGLRWSTSGLHGRNGFLIGYDLAKAYYMITDDSETSPYGSCNPDVDGFIQSIYDDGQGNYSTYALTAGEVSVFGEGLLEAKDINMTFSTDKSIYNFATLGDYYKLIGPKNIIDFGVAGQVDGWYYYNTNTGPGPETTWNAESGMPYIADTNSVDIDEGTAPMFDLVLTSNRSSPGVFHSHSTVDYACTHCAKVKLGNYHLGFIKLVENGATYTVSLELYKFNFSTETLDYISSTSLWSETRPLVFDFNENRILFVPSHGSNDGRLYIGEPEYSGGATDAGRIAVYDFTESTSTLSFNTSLTQNSKAAYEGLCIGWEDSGDYIVSGIDIDDIVMYAYSSGSYDGGSTWAGPKNASFGVCFALGTGHAIFYNADVIRFDRYTNSGGTSWTFASQSTGFSGNGYAHPALTRPAERLGVRYAKLSAWDHSASYRITVYHSTATTMNYFSQLQYFWRECYSEVFTERLFYHYNNDLYQKYGSLYYSGFGTTFKDDPISGIIETFENFLMYNGSDKEYFIMCTVTTSYNQWNWYVTEVGTSDQPHTEIGNWYIYSDIDLSGTTYIIDCAHSYTEPDASCTVTFGFKPDNDSLYYTPNGSGGFNTFSTLELLRAGAASSSLFVSGVPNFSYNGATVLTFYFFLEKTFDETNPLTSPGITSVRMGLYNPGLAEPIICLHFNANEQIKEVYKTTADVLTAVTPNPANAVGVDALVSGSFIRVPFV